jgi:hypothetical protein
MMCSFDIPHDRNSLPHKAGFYCRIFLVISERTTHFKDFPTCFNFFITEFLIVIRSCVLGCLVNRRRRVLINTWQNIGDEWNLVGNSSLRVHAVPLFSLSLFESQQLNHKMNSFNYSYYFLLPHCM